MKKIIKLIAADLDGTLLNSDHQLPEGFYGLIGGMKKLGITFAAASGRQYESLKLLFEPVKEDIAFIAENGGAVFYREECVCSLPMPDEKVLEMIKAAEKVYDKGVRLLLSGERGSYVSDTDPDFAEHSRRYSPKMEVLPKLTDFQGRDHIIKAALFSPDSEKVTYPAVSEFSEDFSVTVSGVYWVDIVAKKANKGNALKMLMKQLGAGYDETMVFGDYLNDLEMMGCCKYSFAMENAHPKLKKAAAFAAPSNNDNGVVKEILKAIPELSEIQEKEN